MRSWATCLTMGKYFLSHLLDIHFCLDVDADPFSHDCVYAVHNDGLLGCRYWHRLFYPSLRHGRAGCGAVHTFFVLHVCLLCGPPLRNRSLSKRLLFLKTVASLQFPGAFNLQNRFVVLRFSVSMIRLGSVRSFGRELRNFRSHFGLSLNVALRFFTTPFRSLSWICLG